MNDAFDRCQSHGLSGSTPAAMLPVRPQKSWMAIGEASTVEEMVQLLEMQVRAQCWHDGHWTWAFTWWCAWVVVATVALVSGCIMPVHAVLCLTTTTSYNIV
jgi:hypothetical protein